MYAIIMAGGEGIRLHPYTLTRPKPMLVINGKPILQYQIEQLRRAEVRNIIIGERYLANVIQDYFSDGSAFGVNITHLDEGERRMGSAGVVREALGLIPDGEDAIVMYGDIISEVDITELIERHKEGGHSLTLWVRPYVVPYGVVCVNDEGVGTSFKEKPTLHINTALSIVRKDIRDQLPGEGDFYTAVESAVDRFSVYINDSAWWHITNEDDLVRTQDELQERTIMREGQNYFGLERR